MSVSPFIPGARVAVAERFGDNVNEGFVEKVYKNGNFTLRGAKQQWKPWCTNWSRGPRWSASETGGGYTRRRLDIWDAETDTEIREKIRETKTRNRWRTLRMKIDAVREPTSAFCDALDAAMAVLQSPQDTASE